MFTSFSPTSNFANLVTSCLAVFIEHIFFKKWTITPDQRQVKKNFQIHLRINIIIDIKEDLFKNFLDAELNMQLTNERDQKEFQAV